MVLPDDDAEPTTNVVRLGTETLFAIGDELRRMYEADLRSKPSEQLERLVRQIERGEDLAVRKEAVRKPAKHQIATESDDA